MLNTIKTDDKHKYYADVLLLIFLLLSAYFIFVPIVKFLFPSTKIMEGAGSKIFVAKIDDIQKGRAKRVIFRNRPVLIIRTEYGLVALSGTCPRTGCYLNWDYSKQQIICPCDYSSFDTNGAPLSGPDVYPLDRFRVELVDDRIYLSEF